MARTSVLGQIHTTLDDKDWILLRQLQKDARRSFAALGRDAGLSAPAAAERLRRLEQSGVIDGYHARVRPSEVGLDLRAFIEIVVKRTDYPRFQKAVEKLQWILECHHVSGRGSFLMKVAVPDVGGLEQLIGHLSQFGDTMTSLILSDVIERREFHP
jgi:Lrp/AsnC family transcriptional regulator, leucine-responsive regulatory protein